MNEPTKTATTTPNGEKKPDHKAKTEPEVIVKTKGAPIDPSEAVRLMLTTLRRVPAEQRAKVLSTLASLA